MLFPCVKYRINFLNKWILLTKTNIQELYIHVNSWNEIYTYFCLFEKWEGVLSRRLTEVGGAPASDGTRHLVEAVMGVRKAGRPHVLRVNVHGLVQFHQGDVVQVCMWVVSGVDDQVTHVMYLSRVHVMAIVHTYTHRPVSGIVVAI